MERNKDRHPHVNDVHVNNITHQASKFAFKVYAQLHELEKPKSRYVIYLDGDNVTQKDIPLDLLDKLKRQSPIMVAALIELFPEINPNNIILTIAWLVKLGICRYYPDDLN